MKKKIIFFVSVLLLISGISLFKEPLKSKYLISKESFSFQDLPWMWVLIENYCFFTCEVPTNIESIIRISEKCIQTDSLFFSGYAGAENDINNMTLPNLKQHKKDLFLKQHDDYIALYITNKKDPALTYVSDFLPCYIHSLIGEIPMRYHNFKEKFIDGRFFDKDNLPIVGHEYIRISEEFTSEKEKLDGSEMKDHPHDYYMYEDKKVPIYQFLEYRQGDKLYNFCDKQPLQSSLPYYQKLAELTEKICEKYDLSRIIFMTLDYRE